MYFWNKMMRNNAQANLTKSCISSLRKSLKSKINNLQSTVKVYWWKFNTRHHCKLWLELIFLKLFDEIYIFTIKNLKLVLQKQVEMSNLAKTFKIIIFYCFEVKAVQQYGHKKIPKSRKKAWLEMAFTLKLKMWKTKWLARGFHILVL